MLPNGLIKFRTTASGSVDGYFEEATFTYTEWGLGSFNVATGEARGINYGDMIIDNGPRNRAFVHFVGQADLLSVWGQYWIVRGTGQYAGLRGQGTYRGSTSTGIDQAFSVAFSGYFRTRP